MSYPTLQLSSDPNMFRVLTHSSLLLPPYNGGPLADTCRSDCFESVPPLFQRLGQRHACCNDQMPGAYGSSTVSCATESSLPRFPGYNLPAFKREPVDNLSGNFCGYARNVRYVGQLGL